MARNVVRTVNSVRAVAFGGGRLSAFALGHALGIVSIVALILYAVLSWFSGFNSAIIIGQYPIGFSFNDWTIIIGVIEAYVIGYIGGWILAKVYNMTLVRRF